MTDLDHAFAAIDAANASDPTLFDGQPLAQTQGQMAEQWVTRLDAAASPALRFAARAHHLRRWAVPRDSYPEGRPGYLRWRRDQKVRHAEELAELLRAAGVEPATVERACTIVGKVGLGSDVEVQTFEDAVCLTFLQTQLASTAARLEHQKMVDVIVKTLVKMSGDAIGLALTVQFDDDMASLVGEAVAAFTERSVQ